MNQKSECIKYIILEELKYSFESLRKELIESLPNGQRFGATAKLMENMLENMQLKRY